MDNSTQYELIRYIDDEMGPAEKAEFEKRLAVDKVLQKELSDMQLAKEAVKQYGLKEKVGGIHLQMMKEFATRTPVNTIHQTRRIVRYAIAIAASVLLIFVLIEGYKFYTLSPEKLYAENYTAYELITTRDGIDSLSAIEEAYTQKNYGEVIKRNAGSVVSIHEIFLTGMAYLETKDYSRAISSFQIVITDIKNNKTVIKDAAEYYLALAYLQNSDYDQAIELMNAIRNNSAHLYKAKFSRKYINRVKRLKWR